MSARRHVLFDAKESCSVTGCLHDRANIEQLARRSVVISMLGGRAGCNWKAYITRDQQLRA